MGARQGIPGCYANKKKAVVCWDEFDLPLVMSTCASVITQYMLTKNTASREQVGARGKGGGD